VNARTSNAPSPARSRTLFTVGHGARAPDELLAVLRDASIARVADVRRYPASRRHPHFARVALEEWLPGAAVAYEWWGEELGGRRKALPVESSRHPAWRDDSFRAYAEHMDTPAFRDAFDALVDEAAARPTTVMCAETVWWRCHRRLIADAATLRGIEVLHLGLGAGARPHVLHPAVRAGDDGWPVYDVGTATELPFP
jgi:uncharacterized protein (DUF488 family)